MRNAFDRDNRILNYVLLHAHSLNVFIEIATDDHTSFKPPDIIVDGNLCEFDDPGVCMYVFDDDNSVSIGVIKDDQSFEEIKVTSLNKILPSLRSAPLCTALVTGKDKNDRQCRNRSKRLSGNQVRCHRHLDTETFSSYIVQKKN